MGGMLPDGTIVPSYFDMKPDLHDPVPILDDSALRAGYVTNIYYPSDKNKPITYKVRSVKADGGGEMCTVEYYPCIASNFFGLSTDRCVSTYRVGAAVLLLCINGESASAVIIGGYQFRKDIRKYPKEHFFDFEFNGFNFKINGNGTAAFTYRGATSDDNTVTSEKNASQQEKEKSGSGSNINFAKDGSIFLQAGDRGDGRLMIGLHHNANLLVLRNAYEFSEFSESNEIEEIANLSEGAKASDDPTKETGTIVLSAMGRVYLNGEEGVHIGAGGSSKEKMPLFESYRSEEKNMHDTLKEKLDTLNQKAIKISTTFQTATFYTAFTCLTTAASDFQEMATAFSAMKSAIEDFESKAENYLSPKNIND